MWLPAQTLRLEPATEKYDFTPANQTRWRKVVIEPGDHNPEIILTGPGSFNMTFPAEKDVNHSRRPYALFDVRLKSLSVIITEPETGQSSHLTCPFGASFGCSLQHLNPGL